jgi:hypothetical protein
MLKQSIALLLGIAAAITTVQPAIARPMTTAETRYLGQLSRLPAYHSLLEAGATKQGVIDMGWRLCQDDKQGMLFVLMSQFRGLEEGRVGTAQDNLAVSVIGGALAIKHLCPEQRSTYGDALNSMVGYSVEGRQRLWDLTD